MRVVLISLLLWMYTGAYAQSVKVETLPSEKFGALTIYKPANPKELVFFISGDGGWKYGVIGMAKALAEKGAMVVGINITHYWRSVQNSKEHCVYLSEDFEALSRYLQTKYKFDTYHNPILAGYSSGATLVYMLLAEAPNGTYKGGIALGFCPGFSTKMKLCEGSGLHYASTNKPGQFVVLPRKDMDTPFYVLDGKFDEICPPDSYKEFMKSASSTKLIELLKVGHGFTKPRNWMPQFLASYNEIVNPVTIKSYSPDFPIDIVDSRENPDMPLVFSISGDGGWKGFIHGLSIDLSKDGMPTVGLDALSYFWKQKTRDQVAADVSSIVSHYLTEWHRKSFILVGYSFGADVIPFVVNRLPEQLKNKLDMIVLLSPDAHADFEFHFASWFDRSSSEAYPVLPELQRMQHINTLVFFGQQEKDHLAFELPKEFKVVFVAGGHGYENNHAHISQVIVNTLEYFRSQEP
ncbi:MAG: virulence factor [Bacteroidales bacterium]|nr:virulence factor [Bacteroidales bacterium]